MFLSRDLDSRLNPRERAAVNMWVRSGLACHSIRDHKYHMAKLQGGMWGCRTKPLLDLLPDGKTLQETAMEFHTKAMANKRDVKYWGADQDYLNEWLWVSAEPSLQSSGRADTPFPRRPWFSTTPSRCAPTTASTALPSSVTSLQWPRPLACSWAAACGLVR